MKSFYLLYGNRPISMPQMNAMNWFLIYLFFTSIFLVTMTKLYYNKNV